LKCDCPGSDLGRAPKNVPIALATAIVGGIEIFTTAAPECTDLHEMFAEPGAAR